MLTTITVTNMNDHGTGSLRAAIIAANLKPDTDMIEFARSVRGTIKLTTGELSVTKTLAIKGPGASELFIHGNNASRVFNNAAANKLAIEGLMIRRGRTDGLGGGILNAGELTLTNVIVTDNVTTNIGGGVANEGAGAKLTITGSTVTNNRAERGGGISNRAGAITTISLSTVQDNRATTNNGGGIMNANTGSTTTVSKCTIAENIGTGLQNLGGGTMKVFHSTVVGNLSQAAPGGGIFSGGTSLSVINCTIVNNTSLGSEGGGGIRVSFGKFSINNSTVTGNADGSGAVTNAGGISFTSGGGGTFTMNNTVVADNFVNNAGPPDVRGALTAGSRGNFIGIGTAELTGITNGVNSNQIGTVASPLDPRLGPLQDNGGPTKTRLPRSSSPLLNAGVDSVIPSGVTKDQRGKPRIVGGTVDIGAVEHG